MRSKVLIASLVIACIICVVGVIGVFRNVEAGSASAPGIIAIRPTLANGNARFTAADVRAYFQAHPTPPQMSLAPGHTAKILSIDFITSKEASQRMKGESVGLPDNALVCYVQLSGPFLLGMISRPPGTKPIPPSDTATVVFDAQTGNILVSGTP
ncbi:MAG TPA: hypothetical protein VKY19_24420 [Ktedonosporobacter sp.]|jgi:hypothetical protein|nr:hypothetical protein [Ktedonosporobacter sp.]